MQWFRWYRGTAEDAKFRVVAKLSKTRITDVIALWALLLEDAAHDDHWGICERNEDDFEAILDMDAGAAERILEAMESRNLISVGHGTITICNWGRRQYTTDKTDPTNAERQKRYRKNKRNGTVTEETVTRNGDETAMKRPEAEAETDTERPRPKSGNGFGRKAGQPDVPLPDDFTPSERSISYFQHKLGHDPPLMARVLTRLRELSARGELRRDWDEAFRWQVDRLAERKPVKSVGAALSGVMRQ